MNTIKQMRSLVGLLFIGSMLAFTGCKKDEPTPLTLQSMTAGAVDLNGATSATGVATDAEITVMFSTDIDAATVTTSTITMTRDYDAAAVDVNVSASGKQVTITPAATMGEGTLYEITMSGLKSKDGQMLEDISRSFTTEGFFAPAGAEAHYTFEGNADDEMGNYNPSANGIVDISYVNSRNADAGKAAEFNGTSSIIEIPNGSALANTGDFTLSLWAKPDSSAHHGGNFVIGNGGYNGFEFEIAKDNCKLAAQYDYGDGTSGSEDLWVDGTGNLGWQGWTFSKDYSSDGGFAAVVQQKWTHFVFVYNSETKVGTAYINGEKAKSQDFNLWPDGDPKQGVVGLTFNSQTGLGENMALGYYCDRATTIYGWADYTDPNTNHYAGLMDDVYIYHKALSAKEVKLMYDSSK